METAAVAQRPIPGLPHGTGDQFPSKYHWSSGNLKFSKRPRKAFGQLTSVRFSDCGHQQYYLLPTSRKEIKIKEKEKSSAVKSVKKKLKFMKRLSTDLSLFSLEAFDKESASGSMNEEELSKAVEVLQAQLSELRAEQKELKRTLKGKRAETGIAKKQAKGNCELSESSSSSSSESSDGENRQVIDMIRLKSKALKQSETSEVQKEIKDPTLMSESATSSIQQEKLEDCCSRTGAEFRTSGGCNNDQSSSSNMEGISSKRIEICMGGKCKKLGAGALLEEFELKAGGECAVSVCKCMGKCRDGPNLRVSTDAATRIQGDAKPSINSVCIGVGLEDVDLIMANILGKDRNGICMMAPA